VAAGVVTWMVVVSLINLVPRFGWPAYAAVEPTLDFSLAMMFMRLLMSAVSSLVSGYIAAWVEHGDKAGWIAGLLILLLFLPDHISLWERFPAWYHLTFLISLPLLGWIGTRLRRPEPAPAMI
jgi:hypothetical protein